MKKNISKTQNNENKNGLEALTPKERKELDALFNKMSEQFFANQKELAKQKELKEEQRLNNAFKARVNRLRYCMTLASVIMFFLAFFLTGCFMIALTGFTSLNPETEGWLPILATCSMVGVSLIAAELLLLKYTFDKIVERYEIDRDCKEETLKTKRAKRAEKIARQKRREELKAERSQSEQKGEATC